MLSHCLVLPVIAVGSTHEPSLQSRRSIKEMEKALQTPLKSTVTGKSKLYDDVIRNITPSGSSQPAMSATPSPSLLSSKPTPQKFDLKFICPHGK